MIHNILEIHYTARSNLAVLLSYKLVDHASLPSGLYMSFLSSLFLTKRVLVL